MRDQKLSGELIQQVTSIGGQRGYALFGDRDGAPDDLLNFLCKQVGCTRLHRSYFPPSQAWYKYAFWAIFHTHCPFPPEESFDCSAKILKEMLILMLRSGNQVFLVYCQSQSQRASLIIFSIEPKGFHTDCPGRSMAIPEKKYPTYDHINVQKAMCAIKGTQAGDSVKGAKAMYELAITKDPPLRAVIGTDAYIAMMGKIECYSENFKVYKNISNRTNVEGHKVP